MATQTVHQLDQWMSLLAIGFLLGVIGQAVRVIPGLYKLNAERRTNPGSAQGEFSAVTLFVSLLIGGVAGAVGAFTMSDRLVGSPADAGKPVAVGSDTILALMGIGYAGADFIEAFAGKYLRGSAGPTDAPPPSGPAAGVPSTAPEAPSAGSALPQSSWADPRAVG